MQSPDPSVTFSLPDNVLQQLNDQGWVVMDSAVAEKDLQAIKSLALSAWENNLFGDAQIGRGSEKKLNQKVRGDSIFWLDPVPSLVNSLIQNIKSQLNSTLWLGLTDFEVHFARYSQNAAYAEHLDQSSQANPLAGQRIISFILYLNPNWQKADGGELQIRDGEELIQIEPVWGRLVLFKSDTVPHSVLASKAERWSLTGWLRKF